MMFTAPKSKTGDASHQKKPVLQKIKRIFPKRKIASHQKKMSMKKAKTAPPNQNKNVSKSKNGSQPSTTILPPLQKLLGSRPEKWWLRDVMRDDEFADEVQSILGEKKAEILATKIMEHNSLERIPLYIITPTYRRPEQLAELTRLAQTLMHVPNMYWLLVEDSNEKTALVTKLLQKWKIRAVHLNNNYRPPSEQMHGNPRGANCRNEGLKWLRDNVQEGVLYFADDDNTYDVELFKEIRTTQRVSMFPVGLCTQIAVSTPVVKNGKFIGFCDGWMGRRKFPVDMAGFAVNVKFLLERPDASMSYAEGYQEDKFLQSLAPFEPEEVELIANNCTKLLVWHTESRNFKHLRPLDMEGYSDTNVATLMDTIEYE